MHSFWCEFRKELQHVYHTQQGVSQVLRCCCADWAIFALLYHWISYIVIFSDLLPEITMTVTYFIDYKERLREKSHVLASFIFSLFSIVLLVKFAKVWGFFSLKITNTSLSFICLQWPFSQATVLLVFRILLQCGLSPFGQTD